MGRKNRYRMPVPSSWSTRRLMAGLRKCGRSLQAKGLIWPLIQWPGPKSSGSPRRCVRKGQSLSMERFRLNRHRSPLFVVLGNNLTVRGYTLFSIVTNSERFERAKRWGIRSCRVRRTETGHRTDVHPWPDSWCASVHGVKRTGREDCGNSGTRL